ncbi:MAG: gamma-glutamyl-gamma-aminobutyrate hydrolase family protein [Dehalococcoidia bacterium]
MAPLIGVTMSDSPARGGRKAGAQLNASYINAVQAAGGVPVLLPAQLGPDGLEAILGRLDGVVLTGGGDIDPARYGQEAHNSVQTEFVSAARDGLEVRVVQWALERERPVLAICRGMQLLNVALGGSLVQDIPTMVEGALAHGTSQQSTAGDRADEPRHGVRVEEGAALARVMGATELEVNSRHHQAVAGLGEGLRAVAWSDDGVIEGAEMPGPAFFLAVQWHPEDLVGESAEARRLFEGLVAASG